jgi:hypothetical protein
MHVPCEAVETVPAEARAQVKVRLEQGAGDGAREEENPGAKPRTERGRNLAWR